jgi:hypothetical protein
VNEQLIEEVRELIAALPGAPMDPNSRVFGYVRDTGRFDTPAQRRRRRKKLGRLARLEREGRLPEQLHRTPRPARRQ